MMATLALLFAAGLPASGNAAAAAPERTPAENPPVLPFTPSGFGDPDAIVCRAPQKLEDDSGMGPRICMHNRVWLRLTQTAKDLAADGKSVFDRPLVEQPHGDGPPEAVTCRKPVRITASRVWHGPIVCLPNEKWAWLYKHDLTITGDGKLVSTRMSGPGQDPTGMPLIQTAPPPKNAPAIGGYYSPL